MRGVRIRWTSAAKAAGAVVAGGLLVFAVSALSEPEEAEPLPADIGLASGATGAYGYAPALVQRPEQAAARSETPARRRPSPGGQARHRPERERHPADRSDHDHSPRKAAPPHGTPASPAPFSQAPAAAAVAPPPPPPSVAAPPVPASEPADSDHDPSPPEQPARPAQFGFER